MDNWAMKKNPGWLGYIGDYTTQLYRDYNKQWTSKYTNLLLRSNPMEHALGASSWRWSLDNQGDSS